MIKGRPERRPFCVAAMPEVLANQLASEMWIAVDGKVLSLWNWLHIVHFLSRIAASSKILRAICGPTRKQLRDRKRGNRS
jgi:hypothetical protein